MSTVDLLNKLLSERDINASEDGQVSEQAALASHMRARNDPGGT